MPVPSPFFRKTASTSLLQRKTMFILYWSRTEARWHPPTVQQASSFLQASCQLCLIISSEQMLFMFSEEIMRHASSHRRPRSNHHRRTTSAASFLQKKTAEIFQLERWGGQPLTSKILISLFLQTNLPATCYFSAKRLVHVTRRWKAEASVWSHPARLHRVFRKNAVTFSSE